jgi:glyoxylase-like metal-dependent hydrolase (beta-lactamase superfamily II)
VIPSLTGVATPGHTPGHRSFVVQSGGERLFILGDLTHTPVLAHETGWDNVFDWDKPLARATRQRVLADLEAGGTLTGVGHYPEPGFGRFTTIDGMRRWVPIG